MSFSVTVTGAGGAALRNAPQGRRRGGRGWSGPALSAGWPDRPRTIRWYGGGCRSVRASPVTGPVPGLSDRDRPSRPRVPV